MLLLAKIQPQKICSNQLLKREKNNLNMFFLPNWIFKKTNVVVSQNSTPKNLEWPTSKKEGGKKCYFCQIEFKKKKLVLLLAKIQPQNFWSDQLLKRKGEKNVIFAKLNLKKKSLKVLVTSWNGDEHKRYVIEGFHS